jgi:hypothetical protein
MDQNGRNSEIPSCELGIFHGFVIALILASWLAIIVPPIFSFILVFRKHLGSQRLNARRAARR